MSLDESAACVDSMPALEAVSHPPRGISPRALLDQVRNTIPFLRADGDFSPRKRHLALLLSEPRPVDHFGYFELCLAAHHATVASFVPTDVDNQIRFKLWQPPLDLDLTARMADLVIESRHWDERSVSTRWIVMPRSGERLSGHQGEWFSTAVAAYCALRKRRTEKASEIAAMIIAEVKHHASCFSELRSERDGIGLLKAATLIAHNLGDLDRVIDAWSLPADDALRAAVYKSGHRTDGLERAQTAALALAGDLNKEYMAKENHRHFALRSARCLRQSADFLLPMGPFFDAWGALLARHPLLGAEDVGAIAEHLVQGWERLKGECVGYARALAGIESAFPGGAARLAQYLPSRTTKTLKTGLLRSQCSTTQARFESQWNQLALNFVFERK